MGTDHRGRILVAGGGGESKTGVPNQMVVLESKEGKIRVSARHDIGSHTITNFATHPKLDKYACGVDANCRIYDTTAGSFDKMDEFQSDFADNVKERVQVCVCSNRGFLVANLCFMKKRVKFNQEGDRLFTGGADGCVRVFEFPSLKKVLTIDDQASEIHDLDVKGDLIAITTRSTCIIYNYKEDVPVARWTVRKPFGFRQCRYVGQLVSPWR